MHTIPVKSLPVKDVIHDIAKALETTCIENGEEYTLNLPAFFGKGFITGIEIKGGMGILVYDCIFKADTQIQFSLNEVNPLKFLYVLSGSIIHRFANDKEKVHKIERYQSSIVAGRSRHGHILIFKKNVRTRMHSLEIDRKKFKEKMKHDINSLNDELKKLFNDVEAKEQFYFKDHFSLELAELFDEMYEFEKVDFLRKLFLEGMAYQALIKQLVLYMDDQKEESERSVLRISEVVKVKEAVLYIENNLINNPDISQISDKVDLTTAKLQHAFKILYHCTVNQFIQKKRLEIARSLILNTEYNMSEIVTKIGLSSNSYFSKIFKENYEISPSEFREKNFSPLHKNN